MKSAYIVPLVLMSLMSSPSWGLTMEDLVQRDGLFYEKFTSTPFTGEINEALHRGSIKNGNLEGYWENYWPNGQLKWMADLKNGRVEGFYNDYWENGQLRAKGNYKNFRREGLWVNYYPNGQLESKGSYKNGELNGYWVFYLKNGNPWSHTGTYKNDVWVSD